MITEKELNDAIEMDEHAEDPNSNTCVTLAAFYIVKDHLFPDEPEELYSNESGYSSDTEFGKIVSTKNIQDIMPIMDELVTTINVLNPQLYASVINKLSDV